MVDAPPGTFVFIPRGTVHAPLSVRPEPGRVLTAFVPGGGERAFDDFARLTPSNPSGTGPSMEQLQAIARRYNSEFVGPPL